MNFWKRRALFSQRAVESQQKREIKAQKIKTKNGKIKGKLSFYCRVLKVSRQAFYERLKHKDQPWKYKYIADEIQKILAEDLYNDIYGRLRMFGAIKLRHKNDSKFRIPSQRTYENTWLKPPPKK